MVSRLIHRLLVAGVIPQLALAESWAAVWGRSERLDCESYDGIFASSVTGLCGHVGPDGPWNFMIWHSYALYAESMPVYPTGALISELITNTTTGFYGPENEWLVEQEFGNWSSWRNSTFVNDTKDVRDDYFRLPASYSLGTEPMEGNLTVAAVDRWTTTLPDGKEYNQTISILGLGGYQRLWQFVNETGGTPEGDWDGVIAPIMPEPLIKQYSEATGGKYTKSWSLHMGSAQHQQNGTFIFGGYDVNTVVGDVGVWPVQSLWMHDLHLGVEVGDSPFDQPGNISVWKGIGDHDDGGSSLRDGHAPPEGTASMRLNSALPYIYLPPDHCEALAEHLPITHRDNLGLYTWDTDDERYERIVSSPAYLGFSFTDSESKNITIKVPFQLLNLTLESPITDEPTPYFPCVSIEFPGPASLGFTGDTVEHDGEWQLGRAFLQAATVIDSYEQNVTFLAQAPGPDMEEENRRDIRSGDQYADDIASAPASLFEKSWEAYWTPLEDKKDQDDDGGGGSGVSQGTLAGAIVGSLAGVGLLAALALVLCRRRRKRSQENQLKLSNSNDGTSPDTSQATPDSHTNSDLKPEMSNDNQRLEASGEPAKRELDATDAARTDESKPELPFDNHSRRVEAPGEPVSRELDSNVVNEAPGSSAIVHEMEGSQVAEAKARQRHVGDSI